MKGTSSIFAATLLVCGVAWPHLKADAAEADEAGTPEVPVRADTEQFAQRLANVGLTTAEPKPTTVAPQLAGYGRVLDPASLIGGYAELAAARSALQASSLESARVQQLHDQGQNASQQAVEAARAAMEQDQVRADAALAQLQSAWGRAIPALADLSAFVRSLAAGDSAIVRIDLPLGSSLSSTPRTAQVSALDGDTWQDIDVLGAAASADPRFQGRAFLGIWRSGPLPPGTALRANVPEGSPSTPALTIPRGAVVIYQGSPFVYVPKADGSFERRLVSLGRAVDDGVIVTDGIGAQDRVVVTGAQELLATEILGMGGEAEAD